jgi:hypothetical protein
MFKYLILLFPLVLVNARRFDHCEVESEDDMAQSPVYVRLDTFEPTFYTVLESPTFKTRFQALMWEALRAHDLKTRIENDLKEQAKTQAELQVGRIVHTQVQAAISAHDADITNKANRAVYDEARKLVSDDTKIKAMIAEHQVDVKREINKVFEDTKAGLEKLYRDHLATIVNEGQYQIVNNALVESLKQRYEREFATLSATQANAFNANTEQMTRTINNALATVNEANTRYTSLLRDVGDLRNSLASQGEWYKWVSVGLAVAMAVGFWTFASSRNR